MSGIYGVSTEHIAGIYDQFAIFLLVYSSSSCKCRALRVCPFSLVWITPSQKLVHKIKL